MLVVVKLDPSHADEQSEMALVELQGELECRTESSTESQFIGDLCYKEQPDGSFLPILIVGHHLLNGKVSKLERPLAVMRRQLNDQNHPEFLVKTIITKKISFKTRPKPIIVG